jgi:UDP-N-acetyl-D-mannosaminuronic acid dehydrogenase
VKNQEFMQKPKKIVIIGGCGHVGLPLGIVFANCGLEVVLLDRDQAKIDTVNGGRMPFMETNALEQLERVVGRKLIATSDPSCLHDSDAAIAVLGTPVDEHLNPTVTDLYRSIDEVIARMPENALLVLRSTVYPGVTKLVFERLQASGCKIHLSFCPERIAEGKAMEEIRTLPQIISAFDSDSLARARELFSIINDDLVELSPLEAELAKLFSNSWRYMNFAISNQFYMLAESYGLDYQRIYGAVTHRYPRMKSFARAGFAAGPCLLKDTLQLSAFSGNNFFLGHAAMLVNEGLPNFIVGQLRQQQKLRDKVVAVLGMAFKSESDDKRESLSYKLRKLLMVEAKEVLCTDPYVVDEKLVPLEEAVDRADVIILGAPHSAYRDLDLSGKKVVVDVWGFWPHSDS